MKVADRLTSAISRPYNANPNAARVRQARAGGSMFRCALRLLERRTRTAAGVPCAVTSCGRRDRSVCSVQARERQDTCC